MGWKDRGVSLRSYPLARLIGGLVDDTFQPFFLVNQRSNNYGNAGGALETSGTWSIIQDNDFDSTNGGAGQSNFGQFDVSIFTHIIIFLRVDLINNTGTAQFAVEWFDVWPFYKDPTPLNAPYVSDPLYFTYSLGPGAQSSQHTLPDQLTLDWIFSADAEVLGHYTVIGKSH